MAATPSAILINGRSMVPLRYISETFGSTVHYDAPTKGITISLDDQRVNMNVGNTSAKVGGKNVVLDVAPLVIAGVTYVPVRFVSTAFGAQVDWIAATREIKIIHPGSGKKIMLIAKDGPGKPRKITINTSGKAKVKRPGNTAAPGQSKRKR